MTTYEKAQALDAFCTEQNGCSNCPLGESPLPCEFNGGNTYHIDELYDLAFPTTEPELDPKPTETVNHPKHYGREDAMECIDEMVLVFGAEATMHFCLLNTWKYRYRAGAKGGEEDLRKSDWYMAKYAELKGGECL